MGENSNNDPPHFEKPLEEINYSTNIFVVVLSLICIIGCTLYIVWKSVSTYSWIKGLGTEISWSTDRPYCGRTISCKITCAQQNGEPLTAEDLTDISNQVVVYVEKRTGNPIKISVIIEDNDILSNGFSVTFTVRQAGEYNVYIHYSCLLWEYAFNGSPFVKEFVSGEMDPTKTKLDIHNPNFVCIQTGIMHQIRIEAKDYYGNVCNSNDFETTQFQFITKDTQTHSNDTAGEVESQFLYNESEGKPCLHIKSNRDSVYQASVLYSGHPILNGSEFSIISLSLSEEQQVEKNLMSYGTFLKYFFPLENIQFFGILLAIGSEVKNVDKTTCRLRITITPRYVYIEEDFNIMFWRKASYNISKKTEMTFSDARTIKGEIMYSIVLSDGTQTPITILLSPGDARILLVTFAHFQGDKLKNFTSYDEKKKCFQKNLCGISLYWRHSKRHIAIRRCNLVESMMAQVAEFSYHDWCALFSVSFEPETPKEHARKLSEDFEWLNLLCDEIFSNNPTGMFSNLGSTNLLHPNLATKRNQKWKEAHYEFAGKILGKCLYESAVAGFPRINVRFTRSLLAQLVGLPVNYQHLVQDFPEECHKIREILKSPDVDKMGLTFTINESSSSNVKGILEWIGIGISTNTDEKINVIPDGSNVKVTNENKVFYLNSIAHYELVYKFSKEISALRSGFNVLVSQELLSDISEHDLDLLLCGGKVFGVKDLKAHHCLSTCHVTNERRNIILSWFWASVTNMNEEERLRLLQLVTGSCVLPAGGFKQLYPKFTISIKGSFGQKPIGIPSLHEISLADHLSFEKFEMNLISVVHGDWRQI